MSTTQEKPRTIPVHVSENSHALLKAIKHYKFIPHGKATDEAIDQYAKKLRVKPLDHKAQQ
jgi:hypothetical protein